MMETTNVSFTPKDVMTLRQRTGLGMMDCKEALTETGGDMAAAEEYLRKKLKGKMDTRTERATAEGRIGIAIEGSKAAIIEVQCEGDFAARNEKFISMVNDVAKLALELPAGPIEPNQQMTNRIDDARIVIQENMKFARGRQLDGGTFGSYLHHDGKRAAIVQIEGAADPDVLKGICQHIVFHNPLGISDKDVPAETIERIRAEAIEEAKQTGKPEPIAQKIAEGRVRKYLEENTLLHQKYVLDETKMVKDVLPQGATITSFVRYTVGAD